jgi:hypothetical protein
VSQKKLLPKPFLLLITHAWNFLLVIDILLLKENVSIEHSLKLLNSTPITLIFKQIYKKKLFF